MTESTAVTGAFTRADGKDATFETGTTVSPIRAVTAPPASLA